MAFDNLRNVEPFIKLVKNLLQEIEGIALHDEHNVSVANEELPINDVTEDGTPYAALIPAATNLWTAEAQGGIPEVWASKNEYFFSLVSEHEIPYPYHTITAENAGTLATGFSLSGDLICDAPEGTLPIGERSRPWLDVGKIKNEMDASSPSGESGVALSKNDAAARIEFLSQILKMCILLHEGDFDQENAYMFPANQDFNNNDINTSPSKVSNKVSQYYSGDPAELQGVGVAATGFLSSHGNARFKFTSQHKDGHQKELNIDSFAGYPSLFGSAQLIYDQLTTVNDNLGKWSPKTVYNSLDEHAGPNVVDVGSHPSSLNPIDRGFSSIGTYGPDAALAHVREISIDHTEEYADIGVYSSVVLAALEAAPIFKGLDLADFDTTGYEIGESKAIITPGLRWNEWECVASLEGFLFWSKELIELLTTYYSEFAPALKGLPVFYGGQSSIIYPKQDSPVDTQEQIELESILAGYDDISIFDIQTMGEEVFNDTLKITEDVKRWWCDLLNMTGVVELDCTTLTAEDLAPESAFTPDIAKCDPELEAAAEEECATCIPDPNAFVVDWTTLNDGAYFLNEKTCEYSVVVRTSEENPYNSIGDLYLADEVAIGAQRLLNAYMKADTLTYTDSNGNVFEESTSNVIFSDALIQSYLGFSIKSEEFPHIPSGGIYASTSPLIKGRVLVVIPAILFNKIPQNLDSVRSIEPPKTGAVVRLFTKDINFMVKQIAGAMRYYAINYASWVLLERQDSGEDYGELNLNVQAENLELFAKDIEIYLQSFGYTFKRAEYLEIGFNENLDQIEYMLVNEPGCPPLPLMVDRLSDAENILYSFSGRWFNRRSLAYIQRIPDIHNDVSAREPLSWNDFILKYTVDLKNTNELSEGLPDSALYCLAESLVGPFDDLLKEISLDVLDLPQAYADKINKMLCSGDKYDRPDIEMGDWAAMSERAALLASEEFFAGDAMVDDLPQIIAALASGGDVKALWKEVFNKYDWCGWLALIDMLLGCLLKGVPAADGIAIMVEAALRALPDDGLQRLFIGLTPEQQNQIAAQVSESLGIIAATPPWEKEYAAGTSYSTGGTKESTPTITEISIENGKNLWNPDDQPTSGWNPQDTSDVYNYRSTLDSGDEHYLSSIEGQQEMTSLYPFLGPDPFAQSGMGTIATGLQDVGEVIVSAYKDAILGTIDTDALLDLLNTLPGAEILRTTISAVDCAIPPLYDPPLDSFFKDVEMDFCRGNICFASCLPKFQGFNIPSNLKDILMEALLEVIEKLVVQALIKIVYTIIKMLLDALCKALGAIGAAVEGAITGDFHEAFKDVFCSEDMSDEDIDEAAVGMIAALNGCNPEILRAVASEFVSDLTLILTDQELVDLLNGDAGPTTLGKIVEIAKLIYPDTFGTCDGFSNIESASLTFSTIGKVVPSKYKNITQPTCGPLLPSLCEPSALQEWEDLQCSLLQENKSLSLEQCTEQLENLRSRIKQDISQLARVAHEGFIDIPDIIPTSDSAYGDPCDASSILPSSDPSTNALIGELTSGMFRTLNLQHTHDMTSNQGVFSRGGVFNMILSNKRGRGFESHMKQIMDEKENRFPERVAGYLQDSYFKTGDMISDSFSTSEEESNRPSVWGVDYPRKFRVCDVDVSTEKLEEYSYSSLQKPLSALPGYFEYTGFGQSAEIEQENFLEVSKNPDLTLKYEDYFDDDKDRYKFDMEYHNFQIVDGKSVLNDYYKVRIHETAETTGDGDFGSWVGISGEQLMESEVVSLISEAEQGTINLNIEEYLSDKKSPKNSIYAKYIMEVISELEGDKSSTNLNDFFDGFYGQYDEIFEKYLRLFSSRLADDSNPAFTHGFPTSYDLSELDEDEEYDPSADFPVPAKVYLDQTYKNIYTGESQPIPPESYGGTADNPAWFITPPVLGGVAGVLQAFVPSEVGCKPRRSPTCDFEQLSELFDEYYDKLKDDPRLQQNPSCASEPPWSKILDRSAQAGTETLIRAIIRIYSVEAIISGLPSFAVFEGKVPEVFDESLIDYIIDMIEEGLLEQKTGFFLRNLFTDPNSFYFSFMEQIVQSYGRRVDLGEIVPSEAEQQAVNRINQLQDKWTKSIGPMLAKNAWPGSMAAGIMAAVASPFGDLASAAGALLGESVATAGKLKEKWWYSFVGNDQALEDTRILMRRYVKDELRYILEGLKEDLRPPISDLHNVFLVNSDFMIGSLDSGGPLDVASVVAGIVDTEKFDAAVGDFAGNGVDDVPFVLERYVKIIDKPLETTAQDFGGTGFGALSADSILSQNLSDAQKNILERNDIPALQDFINFDDFKNYILDNPEIFTEGSSLSSYFESLEFGIRISKISHAMTEEEKTENPDAIDEYSMLQDKIKGGTADAVLKNKAFNLGNHILIPMCWTSKTSDNLENNSITDIANNLDGYFNAELDCLVADLIESPRYKLLFDYAISMKRMVSLLTIYTMKSYIPSVGSKEYDDWSKDGGKFIWFNSGFKYWDRQSHFERSKRLSRNMFMSYYNSQQFDWSPGDTGKDKSTFGFDINIGIPFNLFWWISRMQRFQALDSEGNPCSLKEED